MVSRWAARTALKDARTRLSRPGVGVPGAAGGRAAGCLHAIEYVQASGLGAPGVVHLAAVPNAPHESDVSAHSSSRWPDDTRLRPLSAIVPWYYGFSPRWASIAFPMARQASSPKNSVNCVTLCQPRGLSFPI